MDIDVVGTSRDIRVLTLAVTFLEEEKGYWTEIRNEYSTEKIHTLEERAESTRIIFSLFTEATHALWKQEVSLAPRMNHAYSYYASKQTTNITTQVRAELGRQVLRHEAKNIPLRLAADERGREEQQERDLDVREFFSNELPRLRNHELDSSESAYDIR
ncbi:hypothetical protein BJ508DRAFT_309222 [Ascobolus immersus RN42]|uniref:Uncharacterized protein n=1 Tax=Ascobolus immersus RN42 TaxID=1160509 RepID=A0A3N4I9K2_ASCIM|nr:hypothetical protein BJ508DRAFT_309222 [Ascobolus immersus RN42]